MIDSKIKQVQIICVSGVVTGGTEALHQLCDVLIRQGWKAKIVYMNNHKRVVKQKVPSKFSKYKIKTSTVSPDQKNSLVVLPEVWANWFTDFTKARLCIWWLSYDYAKFTESLFAEESILHLCQSQYVQTILKDKVDVNGTILPLYDYLSIPEIPAISKKDQVVYYSAKTKPEILDAIASLESAGIALIEFKDLSNDELVALLGESKIYIDFGFHGGKDRIPREAAINGCVVVTNRHGAANNSFDIPIPNKYKLEDSFILSSDFLPWIKERLQEYSEEKNDFDEYRKIIGQQEEEFTNQVLKIFGRRERRFWN